ncbi:MAG: hypothetical protein LC640_04485 [Frankia sp.]|nr:hypothetical protein [Frankia sp.]
MEDAALNFSPTIHRGRGDDVLRLTKPAGAPALVVVVGGAASTNFVITSHSSDNQQLDLLVNVIGTYRGTTLIDAGADEETSYLRVQATGPWTIEIRPISRARRFTTSVRGRGDDVVIYDGDDGIATIRGGAPDTNFTVHTYKDSVDLLVNELSRYTGRHPFPSGPMVVKIGADVGVSWSIAVE